MKLVVNGEETEYGVGVNLLDVLVRLGARRESVAVMVNGVVINREKLGAVLLAEGDCVEVVIFAGGG